jgi:hypothetical protein
MAVNKCVKPKNYSKKTAKKTGMMEKAGIFIEYKQEVKRKSRRNL